MWLSFNCGLPADDPRQLQYHLPGILPLLYSQFCVVVYHLEFDRDFEQNAIQEGE